MVSGCYCLFWQIFYPAPFWEALPTIAYHRYYLFVQGGIQEQAENEDQTEFHWDNICDWL